MILLTVAAAAATPEAGLAPLNFLVGHCWEGTFASGEKDTHCFETVYGGKHIRDRHEVTGGKQVYRGESLYSWDGKAGVVTYTYWNSLGGVSRGTMKPGETRLSFGDEVYRGADGKQATISTYWTAISPQSFDWVTRSPEMPGLDRVVRFRRVPAAGQPSAQ